MNRFTLAFSKQDLEKEYFQTVAFPHYFKIFSIWCKLLIFFAIPAVIYTYATDNFQYVGYAFCIIASGICLFTVHKKPASFNIIIALYNLSFVALNVLFILQTDKNIGAKGSDNVMMFIFAGSQYTFHFILSMGSSFLLNSITILIQNLAYSIVFFPGTLNSFNCLLFFATSFLIWVKYSNESQQRTIFLLQKEEEEWSFFIREVLPSSVLMVKYDQQSEEISTKLINRAAARDYNINDASSLKGFMRNTYLNSMKSNGNTKKVEITGIRGVSSGGSSISEFSKITGINSKFSRLNKVQNLEQYIFIRFKQLISPNTIQSSIRGKVQQRQSQNYSRPTKLQEEEEEQNQSKKDEEQQQQQQSWQYQQQQQTCGFLAGDKLQLENSQQLPYFGQQSSGKSQFSQMKFQNGLFSAKPKSPVSQQPVSGQFLIKNSNSKSITHRNTTNNQFELPTQNLTSEGSKQQQYKVEKVKAKVIKDGVEKEIVIKIVFYNLNHPVCSISIDEGLKKQVSEIVSISKTKELLYLSHFQVIQRKFQNILLHSDRGLLLPQCIIHLNHLSNLRESFRHNQPYANQPSIRFRVPSLQYAKLGQSQSYLFPGTAENTNNSSSKQFSLGSLLSHISQIFTPLFESEDIEFNISDTLSNKNIPNKENEGENEKEQQRMKEQRDQNKQEISKYNGSACDMKILDDLRSPVSSERKRGQIEESLVYFKQPKEGEDDNDNMNLDKDKGCVSEILQNDYVFTLNKKILNNEIRNNGLNNGKNNNLKERITQPNKLNTSIGQLKNPFQKKCLGNQELEEDNIKTSSSRKIMNMIESNNSIQNKPIGMSQEQQRQFPSQVQIKNTNNVDLLQDCTVRDTKQVSSRMVFNDSQRICQILINLLSNSLQYLTQIKPGDNGTNKNKNTDKYDQMLDSFSSLRFSSFPRKNTIKTSSSSGKLRSVLLSVKEIPGSDLSSDLIEFKVISQGIDIDQRCMEQLETQLKAYSVDDTTCLPLESTQLGLRISQQILSKVSPINQLLIKSEEDQFEVSFLVYADSSILSATSKKIFSNKTFNSLRESEHFQSCTNQIGKQKEFKGQNEVVPAVDEVQNNNEYLSSCSKRQNNFNEDMIIELYQKSQQCDSPAVEKTQDKLFVPSNSVAALDAESSSQHSNNNNNDKKPDTSRIGRSQFEDNNQNDNILENVNFKSFSQDFYFQRDEEEEEEQQINRKDKGRNETKKDKKEKKKSIAISQLNEL